MSIIYNIGSTWKGFSDIRRIVIFGDSYSSVESLDHNETKPNAADPLGVPFPGSEDMALWNEDGQPNWVGHLLTKYRPGPKYTPPEQPHQSGRMDDQSAAWVEHPLLVHDYAKGGDTVARLARQIRNVFLHGLGKNLAAVPWTAENTLFITWIGINDCALRYQIQNRVLEDLFSLQDEVYNTGARNFLLIDVPPIHRSPAVAKRREESVAKTCAQWNLALREAARSFSSTHEDSSVFIFSSFQLFNTLLDDPVGFGFKETDVKCRGGTFWLDHIHPTSKVHDYIASSLAEFLLGIPANPVL